jgi:recombination protein RecA
MFTKKERTMAKTRKTQDPVPTTDEPKQRSSKFLAAMEAVAAINKTQGMSPSSKIHTGERYAQLERIRTRILTYDIITGGGFPKERMSQVTGPESSFKTTAILNAAATCQKSGGVVLWVQGEEWDKQWALRNGLDPEEIVIIPAAEHGDDALERTATLLESNAFDLCVIDSVQGLATTRELEETDIGDNGYGGGSPQMWSQFCRRVARAFSRGAKTAVVWTSQLRAKIGGFLPPGADREQGTQIWALKHFKSIDVKHTKRDFLKEGSEIVGQQYRVSCSKNKTSIPFREGEFRFYFQSSTVVPPGVDRAFDAVNWGEVSGVIQRAGAWFSVGGLRVQGKEALVEALRKKPEVLVEVEEMILEHYLNG